MEMTDFVSSSNSFHLILQKNKSQRKKIKISDNKESFQFNAKIIKNRSSKTNCTMSRRVV